MSRRWSVAWNLAGVARLLPSRSGRLPPSRTRRPGGQAVPRPRSAAHDGAVGRCSVSGRSNSKPFRGRRCRLPCRRGLANRRVRATISSAPGESMRAADQRTKDCGLLRRNFHKCLILPIVVFQLRKISRRRSTGSSIAQRRRRHAEILAHRSGQMHRLFAVRNGLFVRKHRSVQPRPSRIKVFDFHDEGRKVPYTCTVAKSRSATSVAATQHVPRLARPAPSPMSMRTGRA